LVDTQLDFIGDIRSDQRNLSKDDFTEIDIRKSTKGILKAKFHYAKVQVLSVNNRWLDLILLVRKVTQKQGQRIFVEQIFKEGKNLVGMGDYQIRGWHGFHNHMAICMMAMLLITKLKLENKNEKYTAATLKKIINIAIKTKIETPQLAINLILVQHQRYINQLLRDQKKDRQT